VWAIDNIVSAAHPAARESVPSAPAFWVESTQRRPVSAVERGGRMNGEHADRANGGLLRGRERCTGSLCREGCPVRSCAERATKPAGCSCTTADPARLCERWSCACSGLFGDRDDLTVGRRNGRSHRSTWVTSPASSWVIAMPVSKCATNCGASPRELPKSLQISGSRTGDPAWTHNETAKSQRPQRNYEGPLLTRRRVRRAFWF
jgi:hypothetical protein